MEGKSEPRIDGGKWSVYVDEFFMWRWSCEGDQYGGDGWEQGWNAAKMLGDHFPPETVEMHWMTGSEYGRPYGMLYPMAEEFLNTWGIKCAVAGLPPIQFERESLD